MRNRWRLLAQGVLSTVIDMISTTRTARPRRYLMCRPDHFEVSYEINPWMDASRGADRARAVEQWEALRAVYARLGHEVDLVDALPGLPDMVFAANGGLVVEGVAYGARFTHAERQAEGPAYLEWFAAAGLKAVVAAREVNEGEGDLLLAGRWLLAGWGFRTDRAAHAEAQELLGVPVISLELVDPRYYHLDTCLTVLDDETIAYYPPAFSEGSREVLRRLFPDALIATDEDAAAFGLNAVSDGRNVVLSRGAVDLRAQLAGRGFVPVPVDTSELQKAGGSAKCCTLELRCS